MEEELCRSFKKVKLESTSEEIYEVIQKLEEEYDAEKCLQIYESCSDAGRQVIKDVYMFLRGFEHPETLPPKDIYVNLMKTPFWMFKYPFTPLLGMVDPCPLKVLVSLKHRDYLTVYARQDVEDMLTRLCFLRYSFTETLIPVDIDVEEIRAYNQQSVTFKAGLRELLKIYDPNDTVSDFTVMITDCWVNKFSERDVLIDPEMLYLMYKHELIGKEQIKSILCKSYNRARSMLKKKKVNIKNVDENLRKLRSYPDLETVIREINRQK